MAHFILIPGFNDSSAGQDNIDHSEPLLVDKGHTVDTAKADYGYMGFFRVRFGRHNAVARIANATREAILEKENVVLVGYSNGFNFALKALRLVHGKGVVRLAGIHPASPTKFDLPDSVGHCLVAYTRSDWAVKAASYVHWLIPGWGRLGAVGYRGDDPRVSNTDYSDIARGHGGLWRGESLHTIVSDLIEFADAPSEPKKEISGSYGPDEQPATGVDEPTPARRDDQF